MLDSTGSFTVVGLPDVVVYPDARLVGGFYAVSTAPRIVADDGLPEIGLTLHGRRDRGTFQANGGILTLTTILAIDEADLARLRGALTRRLAQTWPADSREEPPQPRLLSPEWVEAAVEVRLTADLVLAGQPSMTGDNRCSFSIKLSGEQASALSAAWRDSLPDATISYRGRLRGGGSRSVSGGVTSQTSRTSTTSTTSAGSHTSTSHGVREEVSVRFESSREEPPPEADHSAEVQASAPLARSVPDLNEHIAVIEL